MCIAIYSPKGVKLPKRETLEVCFANNPDGIGYMYEENGKYHIRKGFLTFNSFWEDYKSQKLNKKDEVFYHFRIATSGFKDFRSECHPFPVSKEIKDLKALDITYKSALLHNGVLRQGEKDLTDTMIFVKDIMTPVLPYLRKDPAIENAIRSITTGSKIILADQGKVYFSYKKVKPQFDIKNWFLDDNWNPYHVEKLCPFCESEEVLRIENSNKYYCFECDKEFEI